MTPSYIRRVMGKGGTTRWPLADYSGSGKAVSLQPSLLAQGDMVMREPHSLLTIYASAERGRPQP